MAKQETYPFLVPYTALNYKRAFIMVRACSAHTAAAQAACARVLTGTLAFQFDRKLVVS